jgi:hypothetical protein
MIKNMGKRLWNDGKQIQTTSIEVLRHSNMQLSSKNMGEHGESKSNQIKHDENMSKLK